MGGGCARRASVCTDRPRPPASRCEYRLDGFLDFGQIVSGPHAINFVFQLIFEVGAQLVDGVDVVTGEY